MSIFVAGVLDFEFLFQNGQISVKTIHFTVEGAVVVCSTFLLHNCDREVFVVHLIWCLVQQ